MVKFSSNLDVKTLGLPHGAANIVVNRTFLQVELERTPMEDFVAHAGSFKLRPYSDSFLLEAAMEQDMEVGSTCCTDLSSSASDISDEARSKSFEMPDMAELDNLGDTTPHGAVRLVINRTFFQVESERRPMADFAAHAGVFKRRAYSDAFLLEAAMDKQMGTESTCCTDLSSSEPRSNDDARNESFEMPDTSGSDSDDHRPETPMIQVAIRDQHESPDFNDDNCRDTPPTTMMIRNIPRRYSQEHLVMDLQELGFEGTFDSLYIPMDKTTSACVGYAFVNFINPCWAEKCIHSFKDYHFKRHSRGMRKVAQVSVAHSQGLEKNLQLYEDAVRTSKHTMQLPKVLFSTTNVSN